jgi:hypothetical protein
MCVYIYEDSLPYCEPSKSITECITHKIQKVKPTEYCVLYQDKETHGKHLPSLIILLETKKGK